MKKSAVCALLVPLAALTGCFGPSGPDEVAQAWLRAVGAGDAPRACQLSADWKGVPIKRNTPAYRQCLSMIDGNFTTRGGGERLANLKQAEVTSASVEGDKATVSAEDITGVIDPVIDTVTLIRVKNAWYVALD
ncbi:hypothetical protein CGZ95_18980 [Enemella evansiae]|uniref:hypothetical protein n=1 Tax=Enemella evansiae TaxID=2016499 RepID=UPI000B9767A2|nr:hypothetical protein [Enemella evansiae]OYN93440.1 hypothetical protein CGZ95_18980 [Enemella evansiae]